MNKLISFIICLIVVFSLPTVCHAGSIPEDLAYGEDVQLYFGLVTNVERERGDYVGVTVVQYQEIKGEFEKGREIYYKRWNFTQKPDVGKIYLCGYIDDNGPLYLWQVSGNDPFTLQIYNPDDMSQRMQKYLNEGELLDSDYMERVMPAGEVREEHFKYTYKPVSRHEQVQKMRIALWISFIVLAVIVIMVVAVYKLTKHTCRMKK